MQFKLPELGEGVHEGELVKWKVKVGDPVNYDQALCEIMTDKATVEIPSAFKGKVAEIHAKEGETVKVGQVLLSFEGSAAAGAGAGTKEAPASAAQASPTASSPAAASSPSAAKPAPASAVASGGTEVHSRVLASPATRRAARELGVDLARVQGSGEHGRVLREDLAGSAPGSLASAPYGATASAPYGATASAPYGATASAPYGATAAGAPMVARAPLRPQGIAPQQGEERVPFRGLRKKISEKMRLSKDHAAHFTYVEEADATALVELRARAKEIGARQGIKVTFLPFVMKAMVAALKRFPIMNSSLDEEKQELVYKHYFNVGLSIQTEDGLTAPVVKGVEHKTVLELARDIEDLVNRARQKRLTQDDFHGGTITLTNAGSIGGLFATPIINYPEVAIVGFNKIFRKPVAVMKNGREEIEVRDWTYFSISLDHRVVDGAVGAEFMKLFVSYIENPSLLLLENL